MSSRTPAGGAGARALPLALGLLLAASTAQASGLTVNAASRYFGAFGLQVQVSGGAPAYVEDDSPGAERRYRARFYVNANALAMASGDEFDLFTGFSAAGVPQLRVTVRRSGVQNLLRLAARRDDGVFVETPPGSEIALPREWHSVEIDWKASSAAGSNDGALAVWLDGQSRTGLSAIDNDTAQVGLVRWGATEGVEATTTGSFVLDEFDSRRDTYIGSLSVFSDVPLAHPLWRFVHALYNAGVTGGCGGTSFCPDSSVTRDQMSVFLLVSKEGSTYQPPACTTAPFNDVPTSSPFCRWVQELVTRGVTGGCGNGNYCPASAVTRAQMAVFLLVTKEGSSYNPPACTTAPFTDVPATDPFCRWIKELVTRGITAGCGGGNYCPGAAVTRGQMSVFLAATFALTIPMP
jgi:hypothetical protein